jgi:dTDP-4-amino-4,6-dideoxygalactose transaminase
MYLCLAHMSEDGMEQKYVKEAFDTNWVVPLGPNVNGFEKDLEEFVNSLTPNPSPKGEGNLKKRVVALSAGTAAVHLGLLNCGVKPGDEVIVQSFTFCASTHPVTYLGATPVLVDSEPDTWNIDPELLEEAIKDRKAKTGKYPAAIVPVALYGMPYKADRIMEIANKYGIPVVEDAAEGFGSRYKGQVLGTFGKYGVLSFNGNKMITTSGGGALITANDDEWREIMMYATQYRESYPYYQHEKIGYNYRMSNICAGIGRGQMTVVNDHLAHHKHVQKMYEELLKDVPGVHVHSQPNLTPVPSPTGEGSVPVYDSNYWLCTITIDENVKVKGQEDAYKTIVTGAVGGAAGVIHAASSAHTDCEPNANVEAMRVALDQANIEARPVWKPMHKQPVYCRTSEKGIVKSEKFPSGAECLTYDNSVAYVNGVSEAIFKVGMCLPAGPYVTDDDVRYIVDTIKAQIL